MVRANAVSAFAAGLIVVSAIVVKTEAPVKEKSPERAARPWENRAPGHGKTGPEAGWNVPRGVRERGEGGE